jgi:uncharacterized damage-inducible protein DinB
MKQILQPLSAYNLWAHTLLLDCISQLSEADIHRELNSSFTSVYKTLMHIWDAESIWWQRIKLVDNTERPSEHFQEGIEFLRKKILAQSLLWQEFVSNASELQFNHEFAYQNTKKERFKQPVHEVLVHLFNHGTYHRGQLVTMLRELGVAKIPATDFILFCRKK